MNYVVATPPEGSHMFLARRFDERDVTARDEPVAIEMPVALLFAGRSFAVMLATPTDLADFARGFALTEGVVEDFDEIGAVDVRRLERGVEVRVEIPTDRALALDGRRRSLVGRTGCGLCGVDRFSEALRPVAAVEGNGVVTPAALRRAVGELPRHQILNARVGSVHAAAFADETGEILLAREDVGRHNALDKLIGALRVRSIDTARGFVLVSSRCSYEMVHKTASAGIGLISAVSAPTSLAVELAEKVRVGLVGYAREGRFTVYARPERIAEV
ncbi:MAG: formate dehydrogenase accessory sulfurtransferase FdhD [Phyllobacteriaceae bacterium]|nr:formate dehydrogenase accessory sulfurtransferase FdhD [Phyllobacteriaceae bacterium]